MTYSAINESLSTQARNITLPVAIIENLRGLSVSMVDLRASSPKPNPNLKNQVLVFAPVFGYLGQFVDPYNFSLDNPAPPFLYTPPVLGEDKINLVDFTDSLTATPLAVSGATLNAMIVAWNTWITTMTNNISLGSMDSDRGAMALNCITMTRYVLPPPLQPVQTTQSKTSSINRNRKLFQLPENLKVVKLSVAPGNVGDRIFAHTFNQPVPDSSYTEFHSRWVLPKVQLASGTDSQVRLYLNNWQVSFCEPYRILASGSPAGGEGESIPYPELNDAFLQFGTVVSATSFNNQRTVVQSTLMQLQEHGNGGFIGQLIGDFAATTLGMPFLAQLGALVPF